MAIISGGVRMGGFIAPNDSTDTYAVIDPIYGIDGLRNYSGTTAVLDTIPSGRRRAGMLVGLNGTDYYRLKNPPWTNTFSDWALVNLTGSSSTSITGGTYNPISKTLTLNDNLNNTIVITGFTDYFISGLTYSNNLLTVNRTDGQSDLSVLINTMSGLTINGTLIATTANFNDVIINNTLNISGNTTAQSFIKIGGQPNEYLMADGSVSTGGGGGGGITGSGTTNTISKWTALGSLTDSSILDNGSLVNINTNTNIIGNITGTTFIKSNSNSDEILRGDGSSSDTIDGGGF